MSDNPRASTPSVRMQIKCPNCKTEMIVEVGLTLTNPATEPVGCINCNANLIPLVPGPIVGGPFLKMHD